MSRSRTFLKLSASLAFLGLVGCDSSAPPPGADVLAAFETGASREGVLSALPPGDLSPTPEIPEAQLQNGYVMDQYLIGGGTVEVLWLHDPAAGLPSGEFRANLNPLIFQSGVLDGSGWDHLDRRSEEWGLPDRWAETEATPQSEMRSF